MGVIKMKVFYNASDSNQVMAIYTHNTAGTTWTDAGYTMIDIGDSFPAITRDHRLVINSGVVTGITANVNSVQPS
jgi:hypothetical protein